ncbi:MAG: molybdate ABC transporter substrate-binding protein [Arenicellales bacterium]
MNFRLSLIPALVLACVLSSSQSLAAEIRVAAASNFARAMISLASDFEENSGHKVKLVFGSTGKHYAQIHNGAPFDVFFAADIKRPRLLEEQGIAIAGSRFTYAKGKLILWSHMPNYVDSEGEVLRHGSFEHLAIANPNLAPYGRAAREVLKYRGLWDEMKQKVVRGENIGQAFQFVSSGNAELGFVAFSQVKNIDEPIEGSYWEVPQSLYTPIEQQAVLLTDNEAGRSFISYIKSKPALKIISNHGYEIL